MRTISLLPFLLTMLVIASAQPSGKRIYLDGKLNITTKSESSYTAFVTREAGHWIARASYHDGSPLLYISFKNAKLTVKDGHCTFYYPGGKPMQDGDFTLDRADGIWQSWYSNGRLKDSGRAVGNELSGVWKYWYANGQLKSIHEYSHWHGKPTDLPSAPSAPSSPSAPERPLQSSREYYRWSHNITEPDRAFTPEDRRYEYERNDDFERNDGLPYIPASKPIKPIVPELHVTGKFDGQSQSWYPNGQLESTGTYKDNVLTGDWKWYRNNGQLSSIETYSNGQITRLECYDENGTLTDNGCGISSGPVFTDSAFSIRYYILDQLKKLYNKPVDIGRVTIQFTVTKTGQVAHLLILGARTPEVSDAIKQLFTTMPAWLPAHSHNQAIDYSMEVSLF